MVARSDTVLYTEGHRKWYIVALVLATVTFLVAAVEVHRHGIAGWEQQLILNFNHRSDRWRTLAVGVSTIGGSAWTALISVAFSYLSKLYRLCWRLAASFFAAVVLVYLMKHLVNQPEVFHRIVGLHFRVATSSLAFPSGVITIATVIALSLLPYLSIIWRLSLPLGIILIGISRLYLGVQTPLDLIGGAALGIFLVSLIRVMPQSVRVVLRLD